MWHPAGMWAGFVDLDRTGLQIEEFRIKRLIACSLFTRDDVSWSCLRRPCARGDGLYLCVKLSVVFYSLSLTACSHMPCLLSLVIYGCVSVYVCVCSTHNTCTVLVYVHVL